MARVTLYAFAGKNDVGSLAREELFAAIDTAMTTLVTDGASPTQAHVTALYDLYTFLVSTNVGKDFMVDYDRATINTDNLKLQAIRAITAQMMSIQ